MSRGNTNRSMRMIGKLAMKVYEGVEGAYSRALGRLARDQRFLEVVGRINALRNLHKRTADQVQERLLRAWGQPSRQEMTDALSALRRVEAETRALRRELDALKRGPTRRGPGG